MLRRAIIVRIAGEVMPSGVCLVLLLQDESVSSASAAHMILESVWFILQGVCYAKLVILSALHQNFRVYYLRLVQ